MPEKAAGPSREPARTIVLLGAFAPSLVRFWGPLIAAIVGQGHRVVAVAGNIDAQTAARLREIGAEPVSVPVAQTGMNPLRDLRYAYDLVRLFWRERPHMLIAYTAKPVVFGGLAASWAGAPRIVAMITGLGYAFTEGSEPRRRIARAVLRRLYRAALKRCDRIVMQNPDDFRMFRSLGLIHDASRVAVVGGAGVDTQRFAPVPLPESPSFLMISRLLGDKGVREYCAAAIELKRRYPDVRFVLVGGFYASPDAIPRTEVDAWIAGGVEYLGRVEDVRPVIAAASVFVLPSYREGTPTAVLEAMAMGRPIVTTDAPGCRETVIEGENGFMAPVRDAAAVANAMARFIEERGLAARMGARSRALAEAKYDVRLVTEQIMQHAGLW
jgi:glycosyltransferase involved in cell wall biosynthesis